MTECPYCHSDDVTRSSRTFTERLLLPFLRADVHRCRDCRKRFLVNVQWGTVILGLLTAMVTAAVILAMVVAHQHREDEESAAPAPIRRFRPPRPVFPTGLPPLSSVPAPKEDTGAARK